FRECKLRILTIFALMMTSSSALACSCHISSADDVIADIFSPYVFTAIVKEATAIKNDGEYSIVEAKVDIETTYKGDTSNLRKVRTSLSSSMCGLPITVGARYVFVASENGGVSYCSSRIIEENSYDSELETFMQVLKGYAKN
ncbi:hypothetical protein, partial [Aliiglaciecola sp. NS0011-25]|uniref:hypothetical protein n=1 Tax=Aliiglaciecola sp. NS0011-25 TaxID=3127654 RepID=UPI0033413C73